MGHLINPIAFRLGNKKSWENLWYVKNLYYPEFLHNILNIRNFIYFFFKKKKLIKCGLFFSNLNIFKFNKFYIIKLYIYHIDLEKVSYEFINQIYTIYYKNLKSKRKELPKVFFFLHNSDLFLFLFVFYSLLFKPFKIFKKIKRLKNLNKIKSLNNYNLLDYNFSKNVINLKNKIIKNKIIKNIELKKKLNKYYKFFFNLNQNFDLNLIYKKLFYNKSDFDKLFYIKNNFIFTCFYYIYSYIAKKINFKKYNNSWDFYNKWYMILNLLKIFKSINFLYKKERNNTKFFFYLASILYFSEILKIVKKQNQLINYIYY